MTNADAQEWVAHAGADLHYARLGQKDAAALENLVAFHAQQAVEKALKAVLVSRGIDFPKTHDLAQLREFIQGAGVAWPADLDKVVAFTPFATHGRYPGFDEVITRADVDEAIVLAEEVLKWAKAKLQTSN
jgi:HEPN domain-containing protein